MIAARLAIVRPATLHLPRRLRRLAAGAWWCVRWLALGAVLGAATDAVVRASVG
jgi:hypothetical protein